MKWEAPWYIKAVVWVLFATGASVGAIFMAGWKFSPRVDAYMDNRIEKYIAGPRAVRDQQISAIHQRLDSNKEHFDTRLESMDNKLDILIERVK